MAVIDIRGVDSVKALLAGLGGELAEVSRLSQNAMAAEIWKAEKEQMKSDLDRPTAWSVNSLRYKKAGENGSDGAPVIAGAAVYFATPFGDPGLQAEEWLGVQSVSGKTAGPKRTELMLISAGIITHGTVWVPAPAAKLDAYGNLNGMALKKVITDALSNNPGKSSAIIGKPPNARAIITKVRGDWYPYIFFVNRKEYSARYDFYGRVDREIAARFSEIWGKYLDIAISKLS